MTATNAKSLDLLGVETIREMLQSPGPCVTMLLPAYRPGESAGSPAAVLKTSIQDARGKLGAMLPAAAVSKLLRPLEDLAGDTALDGGSHLARVIFRSPHVFDQYHLTGPAMPFCSVSGSFWIRTLLEQLERPPLFYILALSKTKVVPIRCSGVNAQEVALPRGVPATLEEALAFEPPDHDLENRSSVGSSTGTMRRVRFGTGSERETQRTHLADFYKRVDRGLGDLVGAPEIPVILAGVDEDTATFRTVGDYRYIVEEGIGAGPGTAWRHDELIERACEILDGDAMGRHAAALASARERVAPGRFSTDPDLILHRAFEGRVAHLYLNRGANRIGVFERAAYHSWGEEDLLNLAAVQTIAHHGKACALPGEHMSGGAQAEGVMRY